MLSGTKVLHIYYPAMTYRYLYMYIQYSNYVWLGTVPLIGSILSMFSQVQYPSQAPFYLCLVRYSTSHRLHSIYVWLGTVPLIGSILSMFGYSIYVWLGTVTIISSILSMFGQVQYPSQAPFYLCLVRYSTPHRLHSIYVWLGTVPLIGSYVCSVRYSTPLRLHFIM